MQKNSVETAVLNQQVVTATDSSRDIDSFMGLHTRRLSAQSQNSQPIDSRKSMGYSLALLGAENLIVFAFQLISYLALQGMWSNSRWVTGTILLICWVVISSVLIYFSLFVTLKLVRGLLKGLEAILFFFLVAYAVAVLDFAFMAVSYLVVADVIVLLISLSCGFKGIWPHLLIGVLILSDAMWKSFTISTWYWTVVVLVVMTLRIVSLNYYAKTIAELMGLHSPLSYLSRTQEFTFQLWMEVFLEQQTNERKSKVEEGPTKTSYPEGKGIEIGAGDSQLNQT